MTRTYYCSCGVAINGNAGKGSHRAAHQRRGEDATYIPMNEYLKRFPDRDHRGMRKERSL